MILIKLLTIAAMVGKMLDNVLLVCSMGTVFTDIGGFFSNIRDRKVIENNLKKELINSLKMNKM